MNQRSIKRAHADLCHKMTGWLAETIYTAIESLEINLIFLASELVHIDHIQGVLSPAGNKGAFSTSSHVTRPSATVPPCPFPREGPPPHERDMRSWAPFGHPSRERAPPHLTDGRPGPPPHLGGSYRQGCRIHRHRHHDCSRGGRLRGNPPAAHMHRPRSKDGKLKRLCAQPCGLSHLVKQPLLKLCKKPRYWMV